VRDHGVEVGGGGGPGGGMRIQGAVDTATSLDHHHSRGDQARALGQIPDAADLPEEQAR
jgi:hypothetical protein